MNIERMHISDIESYKRLIDGCFGQSNPLERYRSYAVNNNYCIWVMKDGNEIVASVTEYVVDLFTFDFQPCLMLFNVAVSEDYRNQGIGKKLLEFVISNAKSNGYKSISLTCLDTAIPAHKLYESVGFHRASSYKYAMDL